MISRHFLPLPWPGSLLCIVLIFLNVAALAGSVRAEVVSEDDRFDKAHRTIGHGMRALGDRLDRFFADERAEAELQTSTLRLRPTVEWREGGEYEGSIPLRIHIVLPRLERKWQLRFAAIQDEDDDLVADRTDVITDSRAVPSEASDTEAGESVFLTLNYAPVSTVNRNVAISGGPKFRDDTVRLFAQVRFRLSGRLQQWKPRLTQSVFYDGEQFGERTQVDFDRPLAATTHFRAASIATYTEDSIGFELIQRFQVRYRIDAAKGVQTFLSAIGNTRPKTSIDRYVVGVGYRQRLWKHWLNLSLRPQIHYPESAGFAAEPVMFLTLEAVF